MCLMRCGGAYRPLLAPFKGFEEHTRSRGGRRSPGVLEESCPPRSSGADIRLAGSLEASCAGLRATP